VTEHTTPQESVLSVFRGHAAHLDSQSEKAAAREHELNETIPVAQAALGDLKQQIAALTAQAAQLDGEIAQMVKERDEVAAARQTLAEQGAYAHRVISIAEQASTTGTLTDGQLDTREVAQ
jgi:chromosome segregation ATPase